MRCEKKEVLYKEGFHIFGQTVIFCQILIDKVPIMNRLQRCLSCSNAAIRSSVRMTSSTVRSLPKIHIKESPYHHGHHRSNAEQLINKVPVIEVDGTQAVCEGGGGALGHPIEYIQLNLVKTGEANVCKYCGLRFRSKHAH